MTTKAVNFKTHPEQLKRAHEAREIGKSKSPRYYYKRAGMPKIANLRLPQEVDDIFATLEKDKDKELRNDYIRILVKSGWTITSVAKSSGLSTEMVRIILRTGEITGVATSFIAPERPRHQENTKAEHNLPSIEVLERLKELQPLAQKVRSNSPRYRKEAEEYSYLINKAHTEEKVTLYRLGKLLGVTTSALAFRLVRYGYKTTENGGTKVYAEIKKENRAI